VNRGYVGINILVQFTTGFKCISAFNVLPKRKIRSFVTSHARHGSITVARIDMVRFSGNVKIARRH